MFNLGLTHEFGGRVLDEFEDPITIHDPIIVKLAEASKNGPYCGVFYQPMKDPITNHTRRSVYIQIVDELKF